MNLVWECAIQYILHLIFHRIRAKVRIYIFIIFFFFAAKCVIKIGITIWIENTRLRVFSYKFSCLCVHVFGNSVSEKKRYMPINGTEDRIFFFILYIRIIFFCFVVGFRFGRCHNLKCVYFYLFMVLLSIETSCVRRRQRRRRRRLLRSRCEIFCFSFFFIHCSLTLIVSVLLHICLCYK